MKRLTVLLVLLVFLATPALAQGGKQVWAGAGFSVPMGDFGDVAKAGPQLGAGFGFGLGPGYQIFGAGNTGGFVEAMYHHVPGSDETIDGVTFEGTSTEWFDIRGGVVFNFPGI